MSFFNGVRVFLRSYSWWYDGGMKEKTSVTLSPEVLIGIDRLAGSKRSRSAFIDEVLRQYLRERTKVVREARDVEIINRNAKRLNRDAEDGLEDQAPDEW